MRILITGATGFVGSHVAHKLSDAGHRLVICVRQQSNFWRIQDLIATSDFYELDRESPEIYFREHQIDCIVHCATFCGRSDKELIQNIKSNIVFPMELVVAAANNGCGYFVNTDSFFTKDNYYDGGNRYLGGYSLSKRFFAEIGRLAADSYAMHFINMRLEHVYGDWDNPDKFIPSTLEKCRKNASIIPLTLGKQKRDFVCVSDVAAAFAIVVENLNGIEESYTEFGVGTGKSMELRKFVEIMKESTSSSSELGWGLIEMKDGELMQSVARNETLRKLGWKPEITTRAKIKETLTTMKLTGSGGGYFLSSKSFRQLAYIFGQRGVAA